MPLNWNEDPEFASLDYAIKKQAYDNYFEQNLVDNDFKTLPKEQQGEIKNNFYQAEGLGEFEPVDTRSTGEKLATMGSRTARSVAQGVGDIFKGYQAGLQGSLENVDKMYGPAGQDIAQREKADLQTDITRANETAKVFPDVDSETPGFAKGIMGKVEQALVGMGRFAPAMATAPGGPITTFTQMYGMEYDRKLKEGYDHERAAEAATISSALQTPIEFLGDLIQFGGLVKIAKNVGLGKLVTGKLATVIGTVVKNAVTEGTEEYFQQYAQNVADIYAKNPDASPDEIYQEFKKELPETHKQAAQAAEIGAIGGGLLAGGAGVVSGGVNAITGNKQQATPQPVDPLVAVEAKIRDDLQKGTVTPEQLKQERSNLKDDEPIAGVIDKVLGTQPAQTEDQYWAEQQAEIERQRQNRPAPVKEDLTDRRVRETAQTNQKKIALEDAKDVLTENRSVVDLINSAINKMPEQEGPLAEAMRKAEKKRTDAEQEPARVRARAEVEPLVNNFMRRVEKHLPGEATEISNEIEPNLYGMTPDEIRAATNLVDPIIKGVIGRKAKIAEARRAVRGNPAMMSVIDSVVKGLGKPAKAAPVVNPRNAPETTPTKEPQAGAEAGEAKGSNIPGNKIKKKQNEPVNMVMYHGTKRDVLDGNVKYFSPKKELAATYAANRKGENGNVITANINLENPASVDDVIDAAIDIGVAKDRGWNGWELLDDVKVVDELKKRGFDGAHFKEDYGLEDESIYGPSYAVFSPSSIGIKGETESAQQEPQAGAEATQPAKLQPTVKKGKSGTAYLNDNAPVDYEYAVVDAKDLVTSHNEDLTKNSAYPQELQPRDRGRDAMRLQIDEIAGKLNPERLGESTSVSSGAPIVGEDMVVESGNGRTIAIKKAYKGEKGKAYKKWLEENKGKFGIDSIETENPVLVRVRKASTDRAAFARKANQDEVARMSPAETAKADAARLKKTDWELFSPSEDGNVAAASNRQFISSFLAKLGTNETAGYLTADGGYTKQLIDRVNAAVFYNAYQDENIVSMMAEEADPNIKNILNALTVAAGEFAKARAVDPDLMNVAVVDNIMAAVTIINRVRSTPDMNVKTFFQQLGLFDEVPIETQQITEFIDEHKRSSKRQGMFFKAVGRRLKNFIVQRQNQSLPGLKPPDINIKELVKDALEESNEKNQPELFDNAAVQASGKGRREGVGRKDAVPGAKEGQETYKIKDEDTYLSEKQALKFTQSELPFSGPHTGDKAPKKVFRPVRTGMATTGYIAADGNAVLSVEDAASLLAGIRKLAQENAYTVTVDKNGIVLEVHKYSKGTKNAADIAPNEMAGRVLNIPGAAKVYFVHNHPSGTASPSQDDRNISEKVRAILASRDIALESFVVAGREYAAFDGISKKIRPSVRKVKVPVRERVIKETASDQTVINAPEKAVSFIKENFGGSDGILFLSSKLWPVGFSKMEPGATVKSVIADVIAKSEETNSVGVILNSSGPVDAPMRKAIAAVGDNIGLTVFDVIEGGKTIGSPYIPGVLSSAVKDNSVILAIKRTLGNDRGASLLAADIYNSALSLARSGAKTFRKFRKAMRERFADVWEKIKPYMRRLWDIVRNERGEVNVWHGSPHFWTKADMSKIGTGEGAQAFGWGLYFTSEKKIANHYANMVPDRAYNSYRATVKQKYGLDDNLWSGKFSTDTVALTLSNQKTPEQAIEYLTAALKSPRHGVDEKDIEQIKNGIRAIEDIKSGKLAGYVKGNTYRATLHKGKQPGGYNFLDWYEKVSPKYANMIAVQAAKEGIYGGKISQPDKMTYPGWLGKDVAEELRAKGVWPLDVEGQNTLSAYDFISKKFGSDKTFGPKNNPSLQWTDKIKNDKEASLFLLRSGIDGIRYPTESLSGKAKSDAYNYVVFDESAITIEEINGKLIDALKGEAGSAQIINDISEHAYSLIQSGAKNFREFRAAMRERFSAVWDKIKHLMRDLYDAAGRVLANERGSIPVEINKNKQPKGAYLERLMEDPLYKQYTNKIDETNGGMNVKELAKHSDLFKWFDEKYGKGYTDTDMKWLAAALNTPYGLAKKYASMKKHMSIELEAAETRSSLLEKDLKGDLGDLIEKARKDKKFLSDVRDIIWEYDGEKIKDVKAAWHKPMEEGKDIEVNPEHYTQLVAFLESKGYSKPAAEGYATIRKTLDLKHIEIDKLYRSLEQPDQNLIEEFRQDIGKINNYFPHRRTGDAYVQITNSSGEVVYREHYNSYNRIKNGQGKVKQRAAEWLAGEIGAGRLEKGNYDTKIGKVTQLPDEVFFSIPVDAMAQIAQKAGVRIEGSLVEREAERILSSGKVANKAEAVKMARKAIKADVESSLARAMADTIQSRGWGRHAIKRKGTPGHETEDVFGILFDYLSGFAGFKTKIERARQHSEVLREIDAADHPTEYRYASNYVRDMLANQDHVDRAVDKLRGIFFVRYLGFVFKSGLVNLTQNVVMAGPRLSVDTKFAHSKLAKAMKDTRRAVISKAAWTEKEVKYPGLSDVDARAVAVLHEEGASSDQFVRELKGNLPGAGWSKHMKGVIDKAGIFMGVAEKFNRTSTGLAAFRVGYSEKFKDLPENERFSRSVEYAKEIIYDSHFVYGKHNHPAWVRGGPARKVLRAAYTFRSFSHNYLAVMHHLLLNQGWAGKMAVARSLRNIFLLGGLTSIPFFKLFSETLYRLIDKDDDDPLTDVRRLFPETWMRDLVVYGLPGVGGFDLSGSLSIEVPRNWKDIIGIPYAIGEDSYNAYVSWKAGQSFRALSEMPFTPIAVRNAMRGLELYKHGQYTRSGRAINAPGETKAQRLTGWEAIEKAIIGLQPVKLSKGYAAYQALDKTGKFIDNKKRMFADRYTNALVRNDQNAIESTRKDIEKWNQIAIESGKPYLMINVKPSVEHRLKPSIYSIPKNQRQNAIDIYKSW